jgi:hypothetical protein
LAFFNLFVKRLDLQEEKISEEFNQLDALLLGSLPLSKLSDEFDKAVSPNG